MKGSTEPRIFTEPKRELTPSTSLGFAFCEFCDAVLDIGLLPWQEWLAVHALELTEDGNFRFRTVAVLVGRQNGKSLFGKALALFFMYVLRAQMVLGTAQSLETAEEVWDGAVDLAESIDELRAEIQAVSRRNGGKALKLEGGETYKIAAATRSGARGKACDLVLMDELREQTNWDAWGAIAATVTARPNALIWCMSNAGDAQSVVLRHLRMQAHAALGDPDGIVAATDGLAFEPDEDINQDDIAIFEWSAPPGCSVTDIEALAMANPSLGYGFLTERALLAQIRTDPEAVARTEHLCQWVEAVVVPPFPEGAWDGGRDDGSTIPMDEEITYGMDVDMERRKTTIAACGKNEDGLYHIEVVARRPGTSWARDWLSTRAPLKVAMQGRGAPVSTEIETLETIEGVTVVKCEGSDLGAWAGRFYDAVAASAPDTDSDAAPLVHITQPVLDKCAMTAQKKRIGDGAFIWDRRASRDDISPLVACSMAYGAATAQPKASNIHESAYAMEGRGLLVI